MDDYITKPIRLKEVHDKLLAHGKPGGQPAERPAPFDYAAALRRADRETVDIVAGIFLDTWERDVDRLRNAVGAADAPVAERTAHSFRSSLACFAAEPAVAIAVDLERRARAGCLAGMETEIAALEREIRTLAGHLRLVAPADSG
jgi:HPt (histidine-containing phosphotransfer) domain-containing protein